MLKRITIAVIALAVVLLAAMPASAQNIQTFTGWDGQKHHYTFGGGVDDLLRVECTAPAAGIDANIHAADGTALGHTLDALHTIAVDALGVVRTVWAVSQSGTWDINDISGTITLPVGAARDTTSLLILADTNDMLLDTASIDSKTLAPGAALAAASSPVALATDQIGLLASKANQLPDGHNVTVDNVSLTVDGTFWQVTQPVSGAFYQVTQPVSGTFWQVTQPVSIAAGTAIDSLDVDQEASWLDVTTGGGHDALHGVIDHNDLEPADTNLPLKLYVLPPAKDLHEITITATEDDTNDFEYDLIILTTNDIPSAVYDFDAWMSVGALVVPQWKVARDATKAVISQPLIRTHASYLVLIMISAVTEPATNPQMRVLSYTNGNTR